MKCVTGKICYETEELAREALIQNHIRNDHRKGSGPINIYECRDCGQWHFTSKGTRAEFIDDIDVSNRIKMEKRSYKWERRLK